MKSRIIFTILLLLIVFAGLKGSAITEKLLTSDDTEASVITKDSVNSGYIFITSDYKAPFDPFSQFGDSDTIVNSTDFDLHSYGNCPISEFFFLILQELSQYDEDAAMDVSQPHSGNVYFDGDQYLYTKKFEYHNYKGETRYADMILDIFDNGITYLNFYTDKQYSPSLSELQNGVEKMKDITGQLETDLKETSIYRSYTSYGDEEYDESYNETDSFEENLYEELDLSDPSDDVYKIIENALDLRADWFFEKYSDINSLEKLLGLSQYFSTLSFRYSVSEDNILYADPDNTAYCWLNLTTNLFYTIIERLASTGSIINDSTYSAFNGRIYQKTFSDYQDFYIIYNPVTDTVEGVFMPDHFYSW